MSKHSKNTVAQLRSIQHPGLGQSEVVAVEPGRLAFLSDLPRETLRDRFQQCVAQKLPGIRRGELSDYLRAAAEVLDYLYQQHGVQHLALSPRDLLLDSGWLQINDFGLAQLFWQPGGQDLAQDSAALRRAGTVPKANDRRPAISTASPCIYAEMLTGIYPFAGPNPAQRGVPNLEGLPSGRPGGYSTRIVGRPEATLGVVY